MGPAATAAWVWVLGALHRSLALQTANVQSRRSLNSSTPVRDSVQMDPRGLGALDAARAAETCTLLTSKLGDSDIMKTENSRGFKRAMRTEGGIDGVIDILRKHGTTDLKVADACVGALSFAVFYEEENQHYAGSRGIMETLVDVLRAHIDAPDFIRGQIANMGGYMDFCSECGDMAQKHGSDELMMDVMKKYLGDAETVQMCLNGLTGNVYHSALSRSNLKSLGLVGTGLDLVKRYPYGPATFLQIRQEVIAVMTGLGQPGGADAAQIRQAVVDAGYFAQVLKLMEEQPVDAPSQAKSCEFIRSFSSWDESYAKKLVEMGAIKHVVDGIAGYKTPSGGFAGKFWNVDQSGSQALMALSRVPGSRDLMIEAGAVRQLAKAAANPEGGYHTKAYAAAPGACEALRFLAETSKEAQKAVPEACQHAAP